MHELVTALKIVVNNLKKDDLWELVMKGCCDLVKSKTCVEFIEKI